MPILSATTHFSLLRGVLSPKEMCATAHMAGYATVAITDRENLYGLPAFLLNCRDYGIRPIIGVEMVGRTGDVLLYADGNEGYANVCRIISERHCEQSFDLLKSICRDTAGLHAVSDSIAVLTGLREKLPLYYRMKRPRVPPPAVRKLGVLSLVIPAMIFRNEQDYQVHRILRAIDQNTTLSRLAKSEMAGSDNLYRSWSDIRSRFEVFAKELDATEVFAESITSKTDFGAPIMPHFRSSESSPALLRRKAYAGALKRYGTLSDIVVRRLDYELDLIGSKQFCDYFLVVDDIVKQSPRTCGRGSGAASIVAYSLSITNVDPIRYNLMFERFLNPGRTDPPDIDIDFAWDERDGVLDYVFEAYGTEHAAMVATHLTCGARMAIREVARIHGLTEGEISRVTKKFPYLDHSDETPDLEDQIALWPTLQGLILDPPWPQILAEVAKIIGMPRGIGTHCGGVVITPGPIRHFTPVQYSAKGYPIIQWEKDGAEAMGLVKIDLLGNRSLAVIRDAIANVRTDGGVFDEQRIDPQSDPATLTLLAEGRTMGVFYVESPAMRLLQRKTRIGDFEHMVIHSSIIRPAANRFIQEYIRRLHGAPYTALHPLLQDTLSETYGIMVYQEDVSRIAAALAGFSFEDADMLRKIMTKKTRGKKFDDYRGRFYDGARKNNVQDEVIDAIWEMMLSFSGYSFCKPHSASYVQVSFQAAYLKAHFPAAFMAAVISNYGGFYTTQAYISEAQRLCLRIDPPDVNQSSDRYSSRNNTVCVGLCQIRGLSVKGRAMLIEERNRNGRYRNLEDLLVRTGIEESDAERLIAAGACDTLCKEINRAQQFWQMRTFYRTRQGCTHTPPLEPFSAAQVWRAQYRALGFLSSRHPVTLIRPRQKNLTKIEKIDKMIGRTVSFLGWCVTSKTVSTHIGLAMEFVTLEDETGMCETVFFPDAYRKFAAMLNLKTAFVIGGKVTEEVGVAIVEVSRVERP